LSGWTDSKHFFPIFPFVIILISVALVKLAESGKLNEYLSYILIFILVLSALIPNIYSFSSKDEFDMSGTIQFLENNNIENVYTDHSRKWKILFYTQEEIIASCNICQCVNQYPRLESQFINDKDTAYIFRKDSSISRRLLSLLYLRNIPHHSIIIGDDIIIYGMSEPINPEQDLTPCNWLEEQ